MKRVRHLFLVLFFILMMSSSLPVLASEWSDLTGKYVTDYGDTLSNNIGNAIAETEDGYIWIGQYSGLTKYNGSKFVTLTEANGVNLVGVLSLLADGNTLYIGTQNHLVKYENGKFSEIALNESGSVNVNGISLYEGTLYVAANEGLFAYKDGAVETISTSRIVDVAVGSVGGYYIVSDNTNTVYSIKSKKEFYSTFSIKSLFIRNNHLFMGSTEGHVIRYSSSDFQVFDIGSSSAINTFTYADDLLFIGADNGTYTFDGSTIEKFKRMDVTNSIEAIHMDYQKNLWIVSSSNGIAKITSNPFEDLFLKYEISDFLYRRLSISKTGVNGIARYKGCLYMATENCLICVNEATGEVVENDLVDYLIGARIRAITVFENKLYIGVYDADYGVVVYDGVNRTNILASDLAPAGQSSYKAGQIRCFAVSGDSLYIGTNLGISRLSGGVFNTVLPTYRPLFLYISEDTLYACIDGGGIEMFTKDLDFIGRVQDTSNETILKCIKQGNYLLYAAQNNLWVWDITKNTTRKVHLSVTGSVVELLFINGQYYIGTDSDIFVINESEILEENLEYLTLGKGEGLRSGLSSNASGMYDEANNVYYFASRNSCYKYNLEFNPSNEIPSKIAVSSIVIDDKEYSIYDTIVLSSKANRLTIYFDVLNYMDYNTYSVYYKLEGVDAIENMESTGVSSISYTNLSGGKYKLYIYAEDNNGVRTANVIELSIEKELGFFEHTYVIVLFIIFGVLLLAASAAVAVYFTQKQAKKRQNILKKITLESIEAIARTIDAKDKYTNGHSTRVGQYSRMIAEAMDLSEKEVLNIYYIGLLHDIGKIAVPRAILNKPGRLDDEEFAKIKTHTSEGEKILSTISTIPHITEGAKYHHERYDGRGYPEGLSGTNIPFIARIICCADCFDAMATKRSYKEPYTAEKIISEFQRCSGTQFDPEIAKVVIKLIENGILKPDEE